MNDARKTCEELLDAQVNEWNVQIELLKAKADLVRAEEKAEYRKTIEAMQRKQNDAKAKLRELKTAGDDVWEDLKTGAENAWVEVKTAYHDASSMLK